MSACPRLPTPSDQCTGVVSQFSEVPKKAKDRSRSKVPDHGASNDAAPVLRGGRGDGSRRGGDSVRGGRGRGADRGRGGFRGGRGGAAASASRGPAASIPTTESSAWDTPSAGPDTKENAQAAEPATAAPEPQEPAAPAEPPKKTWASMFAPVAAKIAPVLPKPVAELLPEEIQPAPAPSTETPAHEAPQEPSVQADATPTPPTAEDAHEEPPTTIEETPKSTPELSEKASATEVDIAPSKDELTVENVEHLPDESHPPPTETAFSTVASSKDIGSVGVATPVATPLQAPIGRPALGGFATSALKATSGSHRSASHARKLVEQQEAVVMPSNHAVDRAAVQFGSLNLSGNVSDLDVDEDREEAETRTQPPQHSPVTQPRASLPPAPRQAAPQAESQPEEPVPTPKQAPGLPPVPQQQPISQESPSHTAMQPQGSQSSQPYNQFGRYGQTGIPSEAAAPPQKPYDPFGQQIPQSNQYDYPGQQSQAQSQPGAFSSAPDNFGSQYLTSEQQRSAYQNYYQGYGQHNVQSQQEAGSAQQRTGSAFGSGPNDSSFPQSQHSQQVRPSLNDSNSSFSYEQLSDPASHKPYHVHSGVSQQILLDERLGGVGSERTVVDMGLQSWERQISDEHKQTQSRYNDAQNSGHNTPNPTSSGQHPSGPASQGQHMHQHSQQGGQQGHTGGYPYNHPYYGSPYYANYMNQFGGYGQQGGYGSFGKGMYGQPHHYGMSPQSSYEQHSSSPANAGGFGASSTHERGSGLGGGLGEYGRTASSTSQNHSSVAGAGGFGGLPDVFGRPQAYSHQSSYGQQQGGQQGLTDDSLKPFGDSKSGGPSPSALGAQPGRPGSATQNTPGQGAQGGPQQSHQQGFGGYPTHLGGNNQYAGLGGLGHQGAGSHQQQQQQTGYGNYGGFGGYGGSYSRGGWGGNYGGQH